VGSRGEQEVAGGGRRGLWSKVAARGGRGWGRPAGGRVLAAWPLGLGSCRAPEPEGVGGVVEKRKGAVGVSRRRGETEGGRSLGERGVGRLGTWGQLGLEGFDGLLD
jgi:hypothetical protein